MKSVSNENDHFLKLCPGCQLDITVSDEKCMCVKKNDHFLKLCPGGPLDSSVVEEKRV